MWLVKYSVECQNDHDEHAGNGGPERRWVSRWHDYSSGGRRQ